LLVFTPFSCFVTFAGSKGNTGPFSNEKIVYPLGTSGIQKVYVVYCHSSIICR